MERNVIIQGRQEFFIRHHAFRLANSLTYGQVYRLHIRDLTDEQRDSIVAYLRHENLDAQIVQSKAFRGSYIQLPLDQGDRLHKLVDRLDHEHHGELLEVGEWLAKKEGWRTVMSNHGQVMRMEVSALSRGQQDAIFTFLHNRKIAASRIVSKSFRTPYIQINAESVGDFIKLRESFDKGNASYAPLEAESVMAAGASA